jgi:hypothetical protein
MATILQASHDQHAVMVATKRTIGATDGPKSLKSFLSAIALPCCAS